MLKRTATIPVSGDVKDFCVYMGYELLTREGDLYYYKIPADQVCRLRINTERWKNGTFDREKFLHKSEVY